jgi:lysophospholipase L1-like esterase
MDKGRAAREAALAAGYGAGSLAMAGLLGVGLLKAQVAVAKHVIGSNLGPGYNDEGTYGAGIGEPLRILVLGDSTAAGVGAGSAQHTIGAIVATGVAALSGRPVQLRNVARSGATSPQLLSQLDRGLESGPEPHLAIIMVGANDVKERVDQAYAVRCLAQVVTRLREVGAEVVVGTCPDMGVVRPIPQPLRSLVQHWSRQLARAQTVAVVEAGGRTVSLGDLLGPEFRTHWADLFAEDRFHPSAAGYARAAAAILPSVCDALGLLPTETATAPGPRAAERVELLADAAGQAVRAAGSEVSQADGDQRGPWPLARLLRRRQVLPTPDAGATPQEDEAPVIPEAEAAAAGGEAHGGSD